VTGATVNIKFNWLWSLIFICKIWTSKYIHEHSANPSKWGLEQM